MVAIFNKTISVLHNALRKVCFLSLLFLPLCVSAQQQLLDKATVAYDSAQYQEAIEIYDQVFNEYGVCPELYYNLGNAYYKLKQFPQAILNYERCLLYDPSNSDAQKNLELAQLQCVDKIEAIEPVIFVTWSNALRDMFACDTWGYLAFALFILVLSAFMLYFFAVRTSWRKLGFFGGLTALLLCAICLFYANAQRNHIEQRDAAIVMTPSVVVRSSPSDSGTQLFTIHEGLKVRVRSTLSGWSEIELSDGNVGWLPSECITLI